MASDDDNEKERGDESNSGTDTDEPMEEDNGAEEKTIEQRFQKLSQREHVLQRPDTYVGSLEMETKELLVLDPESKKLVKREVTYSPAFLKCFDEIVVNAADNKQRDDKMDRIEISIDQESNVISVKNNGKGIPVEMHKQEKVYVPTMIFGHFLTGSNFDDDEKKTTGGRNGFGAKLTNVYSKEFIVECRDSKSGNHFKQTWCDNMSTVGDPELSKITAKEKKGGDWTCITYKPDLARFGMSTLDTDAVALLSKRAYDIAGVMGVSNDDKGVSNDGKGSGVASKKKAKKKLNVLLNGEKLPIKSFQDYIKLIEGFSAPVAFETVGSRWEIGVGPSNSDALQQISFVNSICTSKGGSHVNAIAGSIAEHLNTVIKKKNKGGSEIKTAVIKAQMCVFVNCLVDNPKFDSQTKECLTTRPKDLGSALKLSDSFLKKVEKSSVVDQILALAKFKEAQQLQKSTAKRKRAKLSIPKLEDANFAGTKRSQECYLIVTEGDSAKSLAMSGISVVGRDRFGVFPLKGKPMNVREASHTKVMENTELANIFEILGVRIGQVYSEENLKSLRYGHLVIMADQDHDGSHIKGLLINMLHKYWPSLLNVRGFLSTFITPIVKCTKKGQETRTFFTIGDYMKWKESTGNNGKGWTIKYYKGLGTSTSKEAKEYFSDLNMHLLDFAQLTSNGGSDVAGDEKKSADEEEGSVPDKSQSASDLIDMVFKKNRAEERKQWLEGYQKDSYIDYAQYRDKPLSYSEFINKEVIQFSKSDCARSIPHVMDGFKPSQRKVLFACFKRNLKAETKVAQLAGYIGEHSAYHHGEASLHSTIINLAQNFSNNINLLTPAGQFGTRRLGGKDAASPRYIFTKLEPIARLIFHPSDDSLLTYLDDDGQSIEPEFYMPVVPFVLCNGADGIGTGWSTSIPNYDIREIIRNIRRKLSGHDMEPMQPFYSGFTGEITQQGTNGKFVTRGCIERKDEKTLLISELPVGKWTQDYKELLEQMLVGNAADRKKGSTKGDKKKADSENTSPQEPCIEDFTENHTDTTVSFTITAAPSKIDEMEKEGLEKKFKLTSKLSTGNMHLYDVDGNIKRYHTPLCIMQEFFALRMEFYVKRKAHLVDQLRQEQTILSNKARFVEEVCTNQLVVSRRKREELLNELRSKKYALLEGGQTRVAPQSDGDSSSNKLSQGFEYLLGMKIWSLTFEKAAELRAQLAEKTKALADLEATSPSQIWLNDLDAIEKALDERDQEIARALEEEKKAQEESRRSQGSGPAKKKRRITKAGKKKTPTKAPVQQAAAKPVDVSMDEDSEKEREEKTSKASRNKSDEEESGMEEAGSKTKKARASPTGKKGATTKPSSSASKKTATNKKNTKKRPLSSSSDGDDEDFSMESADSE